MKKKLRQAYIRLLRSPGAPTEVGGGVALGLVVGLLPIMGLQMPIAIALAELSRRLLKIPVSRIAAAAAVWITNPLTAAPIYGLCFWVGRPFARFMLQAERNAIAQLPAEDVAGLGKSAPFALELITALVLGALIVGIPAAFVAYHLTLRAVRRYQSRRQRRRAARLMVRATS